MGTSLVKEMEGPLGTKNTAWTKVAQNWADQSPLSSRPPAQPLLHSVANNILHPPDKLFPKGKLSLVLGLLQSVPGLTCEKQIIGVWFSMKWVQLQDNGAWCSWD